MDDVDRFDENEIVMTTSAGTLIVTGESLHIGKLSLDGGELHVDGRIDSLLYEDADRPSCSMTACARSACAAAPAAP